MNLRVEPYAQQATIWPSSGRHILAQYDESHIVVYQAYRPEIGHYAAKHGRFGGGFSFSRMTWIKPNFLWMMYRSGWGTKEGQEVTLAIRMQRAGFESLLAEAVPSSFGASSFPDEPAWRAAVAASQVRLQWDPDHGPAGEPLARRAVQIGIRGDALQRFAREQIASIEDISDFVAAQRGAQQRSETLLTPRERVYPLPVELAARVV